MANKQKKLWLATVEHVSVPGIRSVMFFQAEAPSDRAIKRRLIHDAKPSVLTVTAVLDLSHSAEVDDASKKAVVSYANANSRTRFVKVDFEGIIEIRHEDKFGEGFKVIGPADDDRYTVRFIDSAEEAIKEAQTQAELKANDAGGPVMVESYIGMKPIQDKVFPTA